MHKITCDHSITKTISTNIYLVMYISMDTMGQLEEDNIILRD